MANVCNRLIEIGIIFLIVFAPIYYGSVGLRATTVIELTILFMLLVWAVEVADQGGFSFTRTPLNIAVLLFCACSIASTLFFSRYTYASYRGLWLVLCISALYFIVINHVRSIAQFIRLITVILLTGFFHAFSHLIQNATGLLRGSTGMIFSVGNHFAGYMVIIIPLAVAMSLVVRDIGKRILFVFAGVIMGAAMVFSLVAGAMLAFLLSLVFVSLLFTGSQSTRRQALILCSVVVCLLLVVIWFGHAPALDELLTLTNLKTGSPAGRLSLWRSSLAMFADNPVVGTGLSTFDYVYPKYRLPDMYGRAVYAHSDWLQLLTELGIVGSVIAFLGLALFLRLALKTRCIVRRRSDWMKGMVIGGLSSVGAGLMHALVDFNLHIPAIAVLFTIILALTVAGYSRMQDSVANTRHLRPSVRILGVACVFLVVGLCGALIIRPCIADARYQDGVNLEENLLWDEAAGKYRSAIAVCPGNTDYLFALGNVHAKRVNLTRGMGMQEEWYESASEAYHEAIGLCPAIGDFYLVLGNLHESVGSGDTEAAYASAISLDPNNAFYHRIYGDFCLKRGEIQKAVAEYKKSLEVYPSDFRAILNEVCINAKSQNLTPVEQSFMDIARQICPQNTESHVILARYCERKGWDEVAMSEYQLAIALSSERLSLWTRLSDLLVKRGRTNEAAALWRKFLTSHPRNARAHAQLAKVYTRQNRLDDAIRQYLAASELDSGNSVYPIAVGDLYMRQDRPAEALASWQAVIGQEPHAAAAHYRLGRYYEKRGDWILALNSLQQAIAADPKNVDYRLYLAKSYHERELLYEAIQEWKRALELQPENLEAQKALLTARK